MSPDGPPPGAGSASSAAPAKTAQKAPRPHRSHIRYGVIALSLANLLYLPAWREVAILQMPGSRYTEGDPSCRVAVATAVIVAALGLVV